MFISRSNTSLCLPSVRGTIRLWSFANVVANLKYFKRRPPNIFCHQFSCDEDRFLLYCQPNLVILTGYPNISIRLLLVESSVIVIFYVIFLMCYGVNINHYFGKKKFPIKKNQGINNCFKPLTLSLFTSVASRLKSKQKEKEK